MGWREFSAAMALMAMLGGSGALVYRYFESEVGGHGMNPQVDPERVERMRARAQAVLTALQQQQFDVVYEDFAAVLRNRLSRDRLADLWTQLSMQVGFIRAGKDVHSEHVGIYDVVNIGLDTQLGSPLDLQVAFEEGQGIVGLRIATPVRVPVPPEAALPANP